MPAATTVTVPLQIPVELLAKVKEAQASVAPGKRGKLIFNVDIYGNMTAGIGARVGSHVQVAAFGQRTATGEQTGAASVTIDWAPAP